jgi:hypothetical protein
MRVGGAAHGVDEGSGERCWRIPRRQVNPVGEPAGVTAGGREPTGRNIAHGPVKKAVTAARPSGPLSLDWVEWPEPGMTTRWPCGAWAASC